MQKQYWHCIHVSLGFKQNLKGNLAGLKYMIMVWYEQCENWALVRFD